MDRKRLVALVGLHVRAAIPVGIAAGLSAVLRAVVDLSDIAMTFLVAIVVAAISLGRGPALFASILAVSLFDFFFVPPFLTFKVDELRYLLTFAVMLGAGALTSSLADRIRRQTAEAHARELQTAALHALTRALAEAKGADAVAAIAASEVRRVLDVRAVLCVPDASAADGVRVLPPSTKGEEVALDETDLDVAHWSLWHGRPAGRGREQMRDARALALPLGAPDRTLGVLCLVPAPPSSEAILLEGFVAQIALALERATLAAEAEDARQRAESEEMRSSILSSVSHDLRTPIGSVLGAATTLLDERGSLTSEQRQELIATIRDEATRLARLVANLLDMSRVEALGLEITKEWVPVEELVGAVLSRLDARLAGRQVVIRVAPTVVALVDPVLFDLVLSNLVENVLKHTPENSPIEIDARETARGVTLEISDRGPGIPEGSEVRIFEKFVRASPVADGGVGLGLAICRGIAHAHGGTIAASRREGGGAVFSVFVPHVGEPPTLAMEAAG